MSKGIVGAILRVDAANNIYNTDIDDAVYIDAGAVGQLGEVERSTVTDTEFTSQIVDESGIGSTCAVSLSLGLRKTGGGEAHKTLAVRAHLDKGQLKE